MVFYLIILLLLPLLPIMYFQGKMVKKKIPDLPEANGIAGHSLIYDIPGRPVLSLLTVGESTIAGVGVDSHKNGFTGALADNLSHKLNVNIKWEVAAKSGFTVSQIKEEILPTIKNSHFDLVVIGIGANDAFNLNSPKNFTKDIIELIDKVQNIFPHSPIVFLNMPPIKSFPAFPSLLKFILGNLVEQYGRELTRIVKNRINVYYHSEKITLHNWAEKFDLIDEDATFFSDGVHPSPLTYQLWAKDLSSFILNNENLSKYLMMKVS